jgi:predicted nucleic acid-binding protein
VTSTKPIVIDACTVLALAFGEEVHAPKLDVLLEHLSTGSAVVPGIFPVEVIGGLVVAERKGRIAKHDSDTFLKLLESLPISIDTGEGAPLTLEACRQGVMPLSRDHELKAKDACYLDLALRLDLRLATFDAALTRAAQEYDRAFFSTWKGGPGRIVRAGDESDQED